MGRTITAPSESLAKRRCRFSIPGIRRHWAEVMDDGEKAIDVVEGLVLDSRMSQADLPLNHSSFDWNIFLVPDDAYRAMLSKHPRKELRDPDRPELGEVEVMEIEWETKYFPLDFRPVRGDRAWIMGRWIFDCGHKPYKTEIHPPKAVAFSRLEPVVFAGDTLPSWTNVARVFVTGKWGAGGDQEVPIGNQSYSFALDFPGQPSPAAEPRFELHEVNLGGAAPTLQIEDTAGGGKRLVVTFALGDVAPDTRHSFAIAFGWREPVLSVGYRLLRVDLQSITVHKPHDLLDIPPKWNLMARVNSRWLPLIGQPVPNEGALKVRAEEQISLSRRVELLLPMNVELTIESLGWVSRPGEKLFDIQFDAATEAPSEPDVEEDFLQRDIGLDRLVDWVEAGDVGRIRERLTWPEESEIAEDRVALSHQYGHKNTDDDFELAFRVEEIQRFAAGLIQ